MKKIFMSSLVLSAMATPLVAEAASYTVESGDTLYTISQRLGVPLDELFALNNKSEVNHWIYPGEVLGLPGETSETESRPVTSTYVVQEGDTLIGISLKTKTDLVTLFRLNHKSFDNHWIYPGDVLLLSDVSRETSTTPQPGHSVGTQTEKPEVKDASTQTDNLTVRDNSTPLKTSDVGTQTDTTETSDSGTQTETPGTSDNGTPPGISGGGTQTDVPGTEKSETGTPETEKPEVEKTEVEKTETDKPETSDGTAPPEAETSNDTTQDEGNKEEAQPDAEESEDGTDVETTDDANEKEAETDDNVPRETSSDYATYIIEENQSLRFVNELIGVPMDILLSLNDIEDPDAILPVGTVIQLEGPAETAEDTTVEEAVADPMEAFLRIAAEKGLTEAEIQGWGSIIERESGWNTTIENPSSGAYGLPQALPGDKMAAFGDDWRTNPETQLRWMYHYMVQRYGSVEGAVQFWNDNFWY